MRYLLIALLLASAACNPTKRAVKKLDRIRAGHPELFEVVRDTTVRERTVMIRPPVFRMDTFVTLHEGLGKVVAGNSEVVVLRDTADRYQVKVRHVPEEVPVTVYDTEYVEKEFVSTQYVEEGKGYRSFVFGLLLALVIWLLIRFRR